MVKYIQAILIFLFLICYSDTYHRNYFIQTKDSLIANYIQLSENPQITLYIRSQYDWKAFYLASEAENDSLHRRLILDCARSFHNMNEWAGLKIAAETALKKSVEKNDILFTAFSYDYLGHYYMNKSINDSAFFYFLKEKKIYINHRLISHLCTSYLNLTETQFYINDYLAAEESGFRAFKLAHYFKNSDQIFAALAWLGCISHALGEIDKSQKYFIQALAVEQNSPNASDYRRFCFSRFGVNYLLCGRTELAIKYFKRALREAKSSNSNPESYATILDNLGAAEFKFHRFTNIPNLWLEADKIRDNFNIEQGKNFNKLYLSQYYFFRKDTLKAIAFAKEALLISRSYNSPKEIIMILKHLALIDRCKASLYMKEYIQLSDSLQLNERKVQNKFASIAYETSEITQKKNSAIKSKNIILISSSAVLLLGLLMLVIKFQKTKQKELQYLQEQQSTDEAIYNIIHDGQVKINKGREKEKRRISKELQEGIMHHLSVIRQGLSELNHRKDPQTIQNCISLINKLQNIEKDIRQVAHALDNNIFSGNTSFDYILRNLFDDYTYDSKRSVEGEMDSNVNWENVTSVIKMNVYRIIQEILSNYNQDMSGNPFIRIRQNLNALEMCINDDQNNFTSNLVATKLKLKSIRQRVKLFSGKISVKSHLGKGSVINISFPLQDTNASNLAIG